MTEDSTFKKLRQIPFRDMMAIYRTLDEGYSSEWDDLFMSYGWTWAEFVDAYNKNTEV